MSGGDDLEPLEGFQWVVEYEAGRYYAGRGQLRGPLYAAMRFATLAAVELELSTEDLDGAIPLVLVESGVFRSPVLRARGRVQSLEGAKSVLRAIEESETRIAAEREDFKSPAPENGDIVFDLGAGLEEHIEAAEAEERGRDVLQAAIWTAPSAVCVTCGREFEGVVIADRITGSILDLSSVAPEEHPRLGYCSPACTPADHFARRARQ